MLGPKNSTLLVVLLAVVKWTLAERVTLFVDGDKYNLAQIWNKEDFKCYVEQSDKPTVVLFYAHWCGHCKHYSRSFPGYMKKLFNSKTTWQNFINVGAINCGSNEVYYSGLCSRFSIRGVPTFKWFNPHHPTDNIGAELDVAHSMDEMRKVLSLVISGTQFSEDELEGWGDTYDNSSSKPEPSFNLNHTSGACDDYRDIVCVHVSHPDETFLHSVILGMSSYHLMHVVATKEYGDPGTYSIYSPVKNETDARAQVTYAIDWPVQTYSYFGYSSTPDYSNALDNLLASLQTIDGISQSVSIPKMCDNEDPLGMNRRLPELCDEDGRNETMCRIPSSDDAEVISTVLHSAIPAVLRHSSEKAHTEYAKKFLDLLIASNLALEDYEIAAISDAATFLSNNSQFDHIAYKSTVKAFPYASNDWSDKCRGSSRVYRGYTCGLWRLFHRLTVLRGDASYDVAHPIIYYILNFFKCEKCVANFKSRFGYTKMPLEFTDPRLPTANSTHEELVLWLWKWHNRVNLELENSINEDPSFPKYQFPDADDCSTCQFGDQYQLRNVYKFLVKEYGLSDEGLKYPTGVYTFLKSDDENQCPDDFYTWHTSYTTSQYCTRRTDGPADVDQKFPSGTYCVIKAYGHACPPNFNETSISLIQQEGLYIQDFRVFGSVNSKPSGNFTKNLSQIDLCCRQDSTEPLKEKVFPWNFSVLAATCPASITQKEIMHESTGPSDYATIFGSHTEANGKYYLNINVCYF